MSRQNKRSSGDHVLSPALILAVPLLLAALAVLVFLGAGNSGNMAKNAKGGQAHQQLYISEVMTDNDGCLPDDNGKFGDWVEIWNAADEPVDLSCVGLSNRPDRIIFFFPEYILPADGRVIVFCDKTNSNTYNASDPGSSAFHAKFGLSSLGCTVYLFDAGGKELDSVTVPTLNKDESYILTLDKDGGKHYEATDFYSPRYENTVEGYEAYRNHFSVSAGDIVINEIVADARSPLLPDEDGDLSDWIELKNMTDKDIFLKDFCLSDNEQKPFKWRFPDNAVLPANGYYLVFCSGKDKVEKDTYYPHTNFSLSAEGETLVLYSVYGDLVDWVHYDIAQRDMSYGRDPLHTDEWKVYQLATPMYPNSEAGAAKADEHLRAVNPTGVYISEVMTSADKVTAVNGYGACDWVEIYNSADAPVDMSQWGLSDNINRPRKWRFPQGTTIWPGEYKIVLLDKSTEAGTDASRLHASFALSREEGNMMTLSDPAGNVLDRLWVPRIHADVSYGRTRRDGVFFYYDTPTPGSENRSGFTGYAETPDFTLPSGLYEGSVTVGLHVPEGTQVRYTLDGSIPTLSNSVQYTEPLEIKTTTVLRARAFSGTKQPSETVTASYIMNTFYSLRIVSVVMDPDELWNEETGILTEGRDVVKEPGKLPFKNTVYRKYGKTARPAYVEVFEQGESNTAVISQAVKLALMGDYSLDMPQKSMKLRAQASSGKRYFDYPLFSEREYTQYKSFVLRNSGNDCVWTRVIDGVESILVDRYVDTDIITLAFEPCLVYINGQFWGHYNMRERKDGYCICQHEGISDEYAKSITIIKKSRTVVQGTVTEYDNMIAKLKTDFSGTDARTTEALKAYLDENVDIDSFLDWFAIKMYFGDSDPGNVMYYKLPTEGAKWKCLVYDMDYGLFNSEFDSPASYMKEKGMGLENVTNIVFRKILQVPEYQILFYKKMGALYQALTPERMYSVLDELTQRIEPDLEMHFKRWSLDKGWKMVNSDTPSSAEGMFSYWRTRVSRAKNIIRKRPYYIYTLFQKQFRLTDREMLYYFGSPCPEKPKD